MSKIDLIPDILAMFLIVVLLAAFIPIMVTYIQTLEGDAAVYRPILYAILAAFLLGVLKHFRSK